jgi:branched-chain amino acid transport system substrate-binding protein
VFLEGLRRAGPRLTQKGFMEALEAIKDFETGVTLPTSFSATNHEGNQSAKVVEIQPDLTRKVLPVVVRAQDSSKK